MPVSFLKINKKTPEGKRVFSAKIAQELQVMLHKVVGIHGTGIIANAPGYDVGGKTGTTHKVGPHGYYKHRYYAQFAGIAPIKNPKLVIVVTMDDPKGNRYSYFGGVSAAPVFAAMVGSGLRVLGVPPSHDKINQKLFRSQKYFERIIAQA